MLELDLEQLHLKHILLTPLPPLENETEGFFLFEVNWDRFFVFQFDRALQLYLYQLYLNSNVLRSPSREINALVALFDIIWDHFFYITTWLCIPENPQNLLKLNLKQHYFNSITLRSFLEKQMHGFVFNLMPIWDCFFCITRKARSSKETGAEQFASNPILTRS